MKTAFSPHTMKFYPHICRGFFALAQGSRIFIFMQKQRNIHENEDFMMFLVWFKKKSYAMSIITVSQLELCIYQYLFSSFLCFSLLFSAFLCG
jgi:hypothetical protein